jgi:ABC-2 type transport system permease protein
MRLFWELARRAFQRQLVYRSAAFAGLATNFFFGVLRAAVMVALYQGNAEIEGISLIQAITFTGLTQAIIGSLSIFSWYDLMNNVYSGAVATDLLKPMQLYFYWLAQDAGRAFGQFILRGIPIIVAYYFWFDIITPTNIVHWSVFFLAFFLAWLISFSYRFLINLASFWTPNAVGVGRFGFMMIWFFAGFLFPLRFFPEWFIKFCQFTPFPSMVNTTNEVYLGLLTGGNLMLALLTQAFWLVALIISGQLVLRAGIRRLVILGG